MTEHLGLSVRDPRVLIFHIRISMGHERAAQSVSEALQRRCHGRVHVRLADAIVHTPRKIATAACRSYLSIVKYASPLWDFLYDHPLAEKMGAPLLAYWTRRCRSEFLRLMSEFRPDAVVCTQALPARILANLKAWGDGDQPGMDAPIFAVATDFGLHRYWASPGIDRYFLPTREEISRLVTMGVSRDRIECSGIPIHPDMADDVAEPVKEDVRRRLNLIDGRPTVLLMGGSRGMGLERELLREMEFLPSPVNVIALAGTNTATNEDLRRWSVSSRHNVVPLEYTTDIRTLYAISDLAITKPGGLTLAECMAVGLPMVIQHALPGQERHNLEFLRRSGLGDMGADAADVVSRVHGLLTDPRQLEYIRLRLKSYARPDAAFIVADHVMERIHSSRLPATAPVPSSSFAY